MKTFLLIFSLVYVALPTAVLAKPWTAAHKEELLNKLLTFIQDDGDDGRIILAQDDSNGDILGQADNDDAPGMILEQDEGQGDDRMHLQENKEGGGGIQEEDDDNGEVAVIQNLGKLLKKADKKMILAKLEDLKASAQSEAEAQFLHHIFHLIHHLFHHHHHHHPPQAHPIQCHRPQAHPIQHHPSQAHPIQHHPPQAHPIQHHPPQAHSIQHHRPQAHRIQHH